jgi:cysteine-rich repeat protein
MPILIRALPLVVLVCLAGCDRDLRGLQCDPVNGCLAGFTCDQAIQVCVPVEGCEADADCGPNAACDLAVRACISAGPGPGPDPEPNPGCRNLGEPCVGDCCGELFCSDIGFGSFCRDGDCRVEGEPCEAADPCCEGFACDGTECVAGTPNCTANGEICAGDGDCCSNLCGDNGTCIPPQGCFDEGQGPCNGDNDCCAQFCNALQTCEPGCTSNGGTCAGDGDCCFGSSCIGDVCEGSACFNDGAACVVNDECCTGLVCEDRTDDGVPNLTCVPADATPFCGNDVVDGFDQCEPPDSNFACADIGRGTGTAVCDATCVIDEVASGCELPRFCGNGIVELGEACDGSGVFACNDPQLQVACFDNCLGFRADDCCGDGEFADAGACFNLTERPLCGDGLLDAGEQCDDGNNSPGDGCSRGCIIEGGFVCNNGTAPSSCNQLPASCGDGVSSSQFGEVCDPPDGNTCNSFCQPAQCGDGEVQTGEACDDGNLGDGDGCSATCEVEACNGPNADCDGTQGSCCSLLICDVARGRCRSP